MHLEVYAIGKLKKSPILSVIQDYEKRIHGSIKKIGFKSFKIYEYETKKDLSGDSLKKYEAQLLLNNAPHIMIALDETGDIINSQQFAKYLDDLKNNNHEACRFVIGGADGLCTTLQTQVTRKISFGSMTWPHMFVRAMITEQIYRATTILSSHPYHRE